jgi:hypothetical protein
VGDAWYGVLNTRRFRRADHSFLTTNPCKLAFRGSFCTIPARILLSASVVAIPISHLLVAEVSRRGNDLGGSRSSWSAVRDTQNRGSHFVPIAMSVKPEIRIRPRNKVVVPGKKKNDAFPQDCLGLGLRQARHCAGQSWYFYPIEWIVS